MKQIDEKKKRFLLRFVIWWIFGYSCFMTACLILSQLKILSSSTFITTFYSLPMLMFVISWVMDEMLKMIGKKAD